MGEHVAGGDHLGPGRQLHQLLQLTPELVLEGEVHTEAVLEGRHGPLPLAGGGRLLLGPLGARLLLLLHEGLLEGGDLVARIRRDGGDALPAGARPHLKTNTCLLTRPRN